MVQARPGAANARGLRPWPGAAKPLQPGNKTSGILPATHRAARQPGLLLSFKVELREPKSIRRDFDLAAGTGLRRHAASLLQQAMAAVFSLGRAAHRSRQWPRLNQVARKSCGLGESLGLQPLRLHLLASLWLPLRSKPAGWHSPPEPGRRPPPPVACWPA